MSGLNTLRFYSETVYNRYDYSASFCAYGVKRTVFRTGEYEKEPFRIISIKNTLESFVPFVNCFAIGMWAGPPKLDGINDVEEFVTGFVRTDRASISLNGAWAQNINKPEMFIDFLGDKAGARLEYGGKFTVFCGRNGVLEEKKPDYIIPNMYEEEDRAFFEAVSSGVKNKSHIDFVIETAKIMDAIYESAEKGKEIVL